MLFLSCLFLRCLAASPDITHCSALPCPGWPGPALPCPAWTGPALPFPCPAIPCFAPPDLPCLLSAALPCPALPCPALPCPPLPCPALPCPALPCPAPPRPALPYPALMYLAECVCIVLCYYCSALSRPTLCNCPGVLPWAPLLCTHCLHLGASP